MIIVTEKSYSDETVIAAERGSVTWASGVVRVAAFCTEEEFRRAYPDAPEFEDGQDLVVWTRKSQ